MNINPRGADWLAVLEWVRVRMAEHVETALNPRASDDDRRSAAVRADELQQLVSAPVEAIERARRAPPADVQPMETY